MWIRQSSSRIISLFYAFTNNILKFTFPSELFTWHVDPVPKPHLVDSCGGAGWGGLNNGPQMSTA